MEPNIVYYQILYVLFVHICLRFGVFGILNKSGQHMLHLDLMSLLLWNESESCEFVWHTPEPESIFCVSSGPQKN